VLSYKADDTPSTDLNCAAVIMVGMSSPLSLPRATACGREQPQA